MQFAGGDKADEDCKDLGSDEMVHYMDALRDLVKAVSVAHCLGLGPDDF